MQLATEFSMYIVCVYMYMDTTLAPVLRLVTSVARLFTDFTTITHVHVHIHCIYVYWDGIGIGMDSVKFTKDKPLTYLLSVDGFMRIETVCLLALQFFQIDLYGGFLVLTLGCLGGVVGELPSHLFNL